jgi:hypothetical protein
MASGMSSIQPRRCQAICAKWDTHQIRRSESFGRSMYVGPGESAKLARDPPKDLRRAADGFKKSFPEFWNRLATLIAQARAF